MYVLGPCGSLQQTLLWGWEFLPLPPQPPQVFLVIGFEAVFSGAGSLSCAVCLVPQLFLIVYLHANVVPPSPSAAASPPWSSRCHLAVSPRHLSCPSLPLLPVWMNVSSLSPWLSDFHTVLFSVSSSYLLFLNLLLSFFWLYEEAKCIYLRLNLGQNSEFTGCLSILLTVFFVLQRLSSLM